MKKLALCLWVYLLSTRNLFATDGYGRGRDYSLDESVSTHSDGYSIFLLILGIVAGVILIMLTQNDDNKDKGCITIFIVGLIVISFLCLTTLIG